MEQDLLQHTHASIIFSSSFAKARPSHLFQGLNNYFYFYFNHTFNTGSFFEFMCSSLPSHQKALDQRCALTSETFFEMQPTRKLNGWMDGCMDG
jgi:hypothetical protein